MSTHVTLTNPATQDRTEVKVGWDWPLFFSVNAFGLPLFSRKLNLLGMIYFALTVNGLLFAAFEPVGPLTMAFALTYLGLLAWIAANGNGRTVRHLIDAGWRVEQRSAPDARSAKAQGEFSAA